MKYQMSSEMQVLGYTLVALYCVNTNDSNATCDIPNKLILTHFFLEIWPFVMP